GKHYTKPNPVLGMSSIKDIQKNGRTHTRDVCTPFPGLCFDRADGIIALKGYDFAYHDLYHCFVASKMGAHTRAMIKVATIFRTVAKRIEEKADKKLCWGMAWNLEDMEHILYRKGVMADAIKELTQFSPGNRDLTDSDLFWASITLSIEAKTSMISIRGEKTTDEIIRKFIETGALQELVKDVKRNTSRWDEYAITLDSLHHMAAVEKLLVEKMVTEEAEAWEKGSYRYYEEVMKMPQRIEKALSVCPLVIMAEYAKSI
ncbi:MAG: hypothetical protein K1060chlam2_01275, partial [Chlamydiae bacterium]|nr:hypothetical protein [Chlamydiota bacterium]